jgi:hypothetical protein
VPTGLAGRALLFGLPGKCWMKIVPLSPAAYRGKTEART